MSAEASRRYSTAELGTMPTLWQGQTDNLKIDTGAERVWLSRTGVLDGELYENTVTHERLVGSRWITTDSYDGDES